MIRFTFSVCSLALSAACTSEPPPVALAAVDAVALRTGGSDQPDVLRLTGTLRARTETDLAFRVGGLVTARPASPGSAVKAGAVLAELDAGDLQSAANAASLSARSSELEAQAAATSAALSSAEERRLRGLDAAGAISPLVYERAREQAALSQQQAGAAASRAQALQAQAELAASQARHTRLRAPADGVVLEVMAEPGKVIQTGVPVVRFAKQGETEIEVFVPESELDAARHPASVLLPSTSATLRADLRELAAVADPATRTYRARYRLVDQPAAAPALGSTASLTLQRPMAKDALSVPVSAVFWRNEQPKLAVVDKTTGQVALRDIEVLQMGSEFSRVRGQLAAGELLVRSGANALTPGQKVRVITPQSGS